jgi:sugar phosphate isomerase/epimerase
MPDNPDRSHPAGYAKRLRHGEIGKGLNDYDAIFAELKRVGFDGWISIEDGVDGIDQLRRSAEFLKRKTTNTGADIYAHALHDLPAPLDPWHDGR